MTDERIFKKLTEWQKKTEAPPELGELFRRLLQIQLQAEERVGTSKPNLPEQTVKSRTEQGLPAIEFNELELDWALLRDTFVQVATVFSEHPQLLGEFPNKSIEELADKILTSETARTWFEEGKLPSATVTGEDNENLLTNLVHACMKPFLVNIAKALIGLVELESWRRSYCPICGGSPDFAYLEKEVGGRWLLCSRCDAEWIFQRIECPFCNTKDQNNISYYTDDGQYRLYVCDQCKQYLKTVDLRKAKEEVIMPLERLLTFSLDVQAWEYGYEHSGQPYQGLSDRKRAKTSTD